MKNYLKITTACLCIILFSFAFSACDKNEDSSNDITGTATVAPTMDPKYTKIDQTATSKSGEEIAVLHVKDYGDIRIRLFPEGAPKAVENFKTHIKNGYYNGITFHRVKEQFMIQGGDPDGTGTGGESIWGKGKEFEDEFTPYLSNIRGALAMANSGVNTNGSQFFINTNNAIPSLELISQMETLPSQFSPESIDNYKKLGGNYSLDFKHTVFGQVLPEDMAVADKISKTDGNADEKPDNKVIIEKAEIIKAK